QGSAITLSRDGSRLAYMTGSSSLPTLSLYLRPLNRMKSEVLTQGAYNPFFSPDGQWVGFVTPTELKKVSVSGGTPLTLCPVNLSRGASWGETGLIVFAPVPAGGLSLVSAAGGEPRQLTQLEEGEQSHRWPQFLPGGEKVLFTSYSSSDPNAGRIEVVDVSSGERTVVHHGGTYARYSESGHILYANNGTVFASPFDLGQIALTALPAPVLQGITMNREGCAHFDVSDDGNLVYLTGETLGAQRTLKWVNDRGGLESMTETRRDYLHPRLSPEGGRLAAEIFADGNRDIWILDLERDTQTRLTFDEAVDQYPIWSHDGQFVYFGSHREGKYGIFRKRADGSSQEERLTESDAVQSPYSASPDGKFLTIDEQNLKTGSYDIHVLSLGGDGTSAPFLAGSFSEADMVFSPDSEWVAHESNESGEWEIYVRPFPGPGGRWQISTGGGEYPRWSGDGRNHFYRTGNTIWKVPVAVQGDSFEGGRPEELLKRSGSYQAEWDVAADGKRFVIIQEREGGDRGDGNLVNFTFNWFEELELLLETAR
ncbi:MAG: PD40 domain-containing protein, partial [Acidobacteriota bacterium]